MHFTALNPLTIAALWRRTHAMFARAAIVIGAAEALAALTAVTRTRRREIAGWLGLIETIVRKLLMAEAAQLRCAEARAAARLPRLEIIALPPGFRPPHAASPLRTHTPAAPRVIDPTLPHTWPARFKLAPPRAAPSCPERCAPRIRALWGEASRPQPNQAPQPHHRTSAPTPWRLAMRLEALRRVLADPAPYARRLARLLPRLRAPFAERYAIASARPHWVDLEDPRLIVETMALALTVAPLFQNTS